MVPDPVRADPPVRRSGNCAQCGKPRNPRWNKYSGEEAIRDPFCSTGCARTWHGVELPAKPRPGAALTDGSNGATLADRTQTCAQNQGGDPEST